MPTHIDVPCGHYRDVLVYNHPAIVADRKFLAGEGAMNVYALYGTHDSTSPSTRRCFSATMGRPWRWRRSCAIGGSGEGGVREWATVCHDHGPLAHPSPPRDGLNLDYPLWT